jgi:small GTP-binding protein
MSYVHKYSIKIILIGDSNVGKTSLIQRYMRDEFTDYQFQTIGVDFVYRDYVYEGESYGIYIWDTAGQEKFQSMVSQFYRGSNGAVLCFDICNRETFESVPKWITEIRKGNPDIDIILCGTKCDLDPQISVETASTLSDVTHNHHTRNNSYYPVSGKRRQISIDEAVNFAYMNDISYIETSSKTNTNISNTFDTIINEVIKNSKFVSSYSIECIRNIDSRKDIAKINKKYLNIPKNTISLINPDSLNLDMGESKDNIILTKKHSENDTIGYSIRNTIRAYCSIL